MKVLAIQFLAGFSFMSKREGDERTICVVAITLRHIKWGFGLYWGRVAGAEFVDTQQAQRLFTQTNQPNPNP